MKFDYAVTGTQESYGTIVRQFDDSGVVEGELMGDALIELVTHGSCWDGLDTDEPVTITITPSEIPDV
jgi:hypothetical protein